MKPRLRSPRAYARWTFFALCSGCLSGLATALFLTSLDWATRARNADSRLIWLLPVGGFAVGWLYHRYGRDVAGGNNLILEEIHAPRSVLPLTMAPFILLGTLVTHLFGGSAGREGTAVQMGASLSDQLSRVFAIEPEERRILLSAGVGAGFAAAIGTPWAGMLFGMEVVVAGKLRLFAWMECLLASFAGYYTVVAVGAPHSHYPSVAIPSLTFGGAFFAALAGMIFGLAALAFSRVTHLVEAVQSRFVSYPPLKPFLAGLLLVGLYQALGTDRYAGLGIPVIQESLLVPLGFLDPALKAGLTALTVGSGFKGGEFIPLVFLGSTLGNALGALLPLSYSFLAALGFSAVFAGAANTPLACTVMAMELFGARIGPFALLACLASFYCSGRSGIYRSQQGPASKHRTLLRMLAWLGNLPRRFYSTS